MRVFMLTPVFVEQIPSRIEAGTLYVSMQYGTAVHACSCGCGCEVVTPFSPTDWRIIYDGEHVSLEPSIGNWSFPCRSHYWITRNVVRWAAALSEAQIAGGRADDRATKARVYGTQVAEEATRDRWWTRAWERFTRRR